MPFSAPPDLNREITYLLRWPAWLAKKTGQAAIARHMSMAAWLREAVSEKLEREAAQRPGYQIQPGRPVLVAPDLDDLKGPTEGTIELPLSLFWSRGDRTFDLADPGALLEAYETVLLESASLGELTSLLNKNLLIEVWPQVYSKPVRRAWEDRHPVLREAAARAAA